MLKRVLLVDDEPSILSAMQRLLGTEYDLTTAFCGEQGLLAIGERATFPVVITDMRMPKMNGIQFIQAARAKSPDSVYLMLTGNQDQATAIQALNEGEVFRFLTKPCQSQDLRNAIEAGMRQYQLITSEKELLQNTFVGAVSVLMDILELSQPKIFERAGRVQEIVGLLQESLRLEGCWEYKLAARLGLLGFALLPEQERARFETGSASGDQLHAMIVGAAATGRRILERIPRLATVARIIGMMGEINGSMLCTKPKSDAEGSGAGATLLRVAVQWDYLVRQGLSPRAAANEIRASLPELPNIVTTVLAEQDVAHIGDRGVTCEFSELVEGMVLQDDVVTGDGVTLIRGGRRITWTMIEKLRSYQTSAAGLRPIRVRGADAAPQQAVLA